MLDLNIKYLTFIFGLDLRPGEVQGRMGQVPDKRKTEGRGGRRTRERSFCLLLHVLLITQTKKRYFIM